MWCRSHLEDRNESPKPGSSSGGSLGSIPGHKSAWDGSPMGLVNSVSGGRRLSNVSDSGDTGIGTYCSDSVEDDSSSSTAALTFQTPSQHHLCQGYDVNLTILPSSSSSSPYASGRTSASPISPSGWSRSNQSFTPAISPVGAGSCLGLRERQPVRKWSSLTELSSGAPKSSTQTSGHQYNQFSQGSLDRGLLYGFRRQSNDSNANLHLHLSPSLSGQSLQQLSPVASPCYRYNNSSGLRELETDPSHLSSSPAQHDTLDMNYNALSEATLPQVGRQVSIPKVDPWMSLHTNEGRNVQTALRTQMWLNEQMEYRPKVVHGSKFGQITTSAGPEDCEADGLSPRQQKHQRDPGFKQMVTGAGLHVSTLVKIKEGLLRQRELEIVRQKQHILQLQARITENELRVQQVLQSQKRWLEEPYILNAMESLIQTSSKQRSDEDLGQKLAVAELKVLHLNEIFRHVTEKYAEDIRKLEEKIKTRDRYISSLKKKCLRESEQNQEKQQRVETLEKYLSDLLAMGEVQAQSRSQQQEEVQKKAKDLQKTMAEFQKSLEEGCALMKEKNIKIEMQAKRERELYASVHSLQKKVQQCLDDGVRFPMQELKQLEVENTQLLKQQADSGRLIGHQKEQIERLTSQLKATSRRLLQKRGVPHPQRSYWEPEKEESLAVGPRVLPQQRLMDEGLLLNSLSHVKVQDVGRLLKEMSLCLLDLQALCSILAQRAQGKEPNLSLLLGMKSLSVSAEESDLVMEEEVRFKLLEVSQMRRDIDELRKSISDRCTH